MPFDLIVPLPCCALGVRFAGGSLTYAEFLPAATPSQAASGALPEQIERWIAAYLRHPAELPELPLQIVGTPHRQKVWAAMLAIPPGQVRTYGEVAREIASAPRAVGQACGANPLPLFVPCHRIVGGAGLGGFMNARDGDPLAIKRWLLRHEGVAV